MSEEQGKNFEEEKIKLVEPYNPTDPIVVFDPKILQPIIVRQYVNEEENVPQDAVGNITDQNNIDIEGIKVPILSLNNYIVEYHNIIDFKLHISGFLPTLELTVYDENEKIKALDVPGMENQISVILIAPLEGANKKISLRFYILECTFNDDGTIKYKAELKLNNMWAVRNEQIGNDKLSTYEMFEEIAKKNDLGFAATEDCKDIEDKRWRQMYHQTYKEYIKEQLSFGGKDENSVFDAWVDEFGYLVLVNVPWVFNYQLKMEQLTIKTINGINTGSKLSEDNKVSLDETLRMITNTKHSATSENLKFISYSHEVDNNCLLQDGTACVYYYMTGIGDTNQIQLHEGKVEETSIDGKSEEDTTEYNVDNIEFIGFDMTDDDDEENTPIIVQEKNVKNFFNSIYTKEIKVIMTKPNYLLQRGTLVVVDIEEYNSLAKKEVLDNSTNAIKSQVDDDLSSPAEDENLLLEANMESFGNTMDGVPNFAQCGIYYIKSITFMYSSGSDEIMQEMTLVKRGIRNNIMNKNTSVTAE